MRKRLRELTTRGNRWGNQEREKKLQEYTKGWINYFRYADMKKLMEQTDEWLRHRISCSVLETMEESAHKIQDVEGVTPARMESTRNGELPERRVEGGSYAELCAYKNNNSGQTWIPIHVSPLPESTCKLLNRLGTERYARWCGRGTNHPPIRLAGACRDTLFSRGEK